MNIPEKSLALVFGYLPNVDRLPKAASTAGLTRRVAIALDTYRSDKDGTYFDSELAIALLCAASAAIQHDRLESGNGTLTELGQH